MAGAPSNTVFDRLRRWARALRQDVHALYLAGRDPRVPWPAKLLALAIAVYALSPIDLIPDFIPVLGYLDEIILLPLAIWLALKLIPPDILAEHRATAAAVAQQRSSRAGAALVVVLWVIATAALLWLLWPHLAE